jgi:peroxiredoxin
MKLHQVSVGALMLLLSGVPTVFAQTQQPFTIKGQLAPDQQGMIRIQYTANQTDIKDSSQVVNGAFTLKGQVAEPAFGMLVFTPANKSDKWQYKELFIDPATTIESNGSGDLFSATIKGGESQKDFLELMENYKPIAEKGRKLDSMFKIYMDEGDEENAKNIDKQRMELRMERRDVQLAFAAAHPNSYVGFNLWLRKVPNFIREPKLLQEEFRKFSSRIRNSVEGKKLAARLAAAEKLAPGTKAPDLTLNDVNGKPVSLSSLKGKNVLLVFWVRNFVPFDAFSFAMNKISRQCKDENLVILSVYYDSNNKNDWQKIIDETGMKGDNIINVTDPAKLTSDAAGSAVIKAYSLTSGAMPHNYLIGTDGKILARDVNMAQEPVKEIKQLIKK